MKKTIFFLFLLVLQTAGALSLRNGEALAQSNDLYVVRDIAVDISDISAVEARRKALQEAQLLGFHRLVRRAILREDWERLPRVTFEEIHSMILSLEIESEKSSTTRYLANVTISFDPFALQSLLSDASIMFLEFSPPAALVLPLYFDKGEWVLWRKPNPWWNAWSELNIDLLATSYLLPLGDLEDRLALSSENLDADEDAALVRIAVRYGVDRILLTRAFPDEGGEIQTRVSVYNILPSGREVRNLNSFNFRAPNLKHAVASLTERMEQNWKLRTIGKPNKSATLRLRARFDSIEEWAKMRLILESASYIRSLQVERMDVRGAWLKLRFIGNRQMLIDGLRRNGFLVARKLDEFNQDLQEILTLHLASTTPQQNSEP